MDKELARKLQENTEWMIEHLSIVDKIAYISPVKIEIDDDYVIWTLTFEDHQVTSTRLEDAVDVAVRHVNKEIDAEVIATAALGPAPQRPQPGDVENTEGM
jgi:hypothetical protein